MTTRFAWLLEPYHLRSNLREVESAIRRGLLDAPERADLRRVLDELTAGGLTARETVRVERIRLAIGPG